MSKHRYSDVSFKAGDRVRSVVHEVNELPYGNIQIPHGNGTVLRCAKNGDCLVWFDAGDKLIVPPRTLAKSGVLGPAAHFREVERLRGTHREVWKD